MKKFVAFTMILAMLSTAFIGSAVIPAYAEENITQAPLSTQEPAVGVWMNNPEGIWFRTTFNAASSFKNFECLLYAGKSAESKEALVIYELYSWYYNKEATLAREPVASGSFVADGDNWVTIDFDTMPAGQYILELRQAPSSEQSGTENYFVVGVADPVEGVDIYCEYSDNATNTTPGKSLICGKIGFLTNESGVYYNTLLKDAAVPTDTSEDTTPSPESSTAATPSTSTAAPSTSGGEADTPPTGDSDITVIICLALLAMFAIAGSRVIIKRKTSK